MYLESESKRELLSVMEGGREKGRKRGSDKGRVRDGRMEGNKSLGDTNFSSHWASDEQLHVLHQHVHTQTHTYKHIHTHPTESFFLLFLFSGSRWCQRREGRASEAFFSFYVSTKQQQLDGYVRLTLLCFLLRGTSNHRLPSEPSPGRCASSSSRVSSGLRSGIVRPSPPRGTQVKPK